MDNVKCRAVMKEGSGLRSGRDSKAEFIQLMFLTICGACTDLWDEEDGTHFGGLTLKEKSMPCLFCMLSTVHSRVARACLTETFDSLKLLHWS